MGINFSKVNFSYYIPKKKVQIKYTLKDINLNISGNDEFITILGHTGSGKSTLVQLMNALNLPTDGEVEVFGTKITRKAKVLLKPVRQKVGLVFQFPEYQIFEESVIKDIEFGPKNFGLNQDKAHEAAIEAAKLVGLDDALLERSPFTLSGGQMRKVAISGIIASNPDILVLDEPTVGLDPFGKKELMSLLKKFNEEYHKTIVIITHDMEVVSRYSKRTIVLNHGNMLYDGPTSELFKNEDLKTKFNLDYPEIVKTMIALKEELNLEDLDVFKYNELDAYNELARVLGEKDE